jgi:glycosyltransferase involved in cell wall biosynthesis
MTRVLILGQSPLPFEEQGVAYGPGRRTWQIVSPLIDDGHEVCLLASRISGTYADDLPPVWEQDTTPFPYYSMKESRYTDVRMLRRLAREFAPDCIVGVTPFPCSVAADLHLDIPIWADLHGSVMTEAQMKAFVYDDDLYVSHFRQYEVKALDRADHFSCVSQRQVYALIGELGLWGRLNRLTAGHSLVDLIPLASETRPYEHTKDVIRGVLVEDGGFVVLYSGGYNTWVDVDTLFHALEEAMSSVHNLVFVSTGGQIQGHDDLTFWQLRQMVAGSPYQSRFHFQGWVPAQDLPNYYLESDLAVNTDRFCYEATLGSRHRMLDWLRAGLPFVTTPLPEIADYLARQGAAFLYNPEDADDLARQLIRLASERDTLVAAAQRARSLLASEFTYQKTTEGLRRWAASPSFAPDHAAPIPRLTSASPRMQLLSRPSRVRLMQLATNLWGSVSSALTSVGLQRLEPPIRKLTRRLLGLDRPTYRVRYSDLSVPRQMEAHRQYTAEVTLRNDGHQPWLPPSVDRRGFSISYHWRSADGTMLNRDGLRTPIPGEVARNASVRAKFNIQAPPDPGRYLLEIDVHREQVGWLGELGSETTNVEVHVVHGR